MSSIDLKKSLREEEKILLQWREENKNKDKNWQIGVTIFLGLCFLFFFWQKNYWGSVLVLIIFLLIFSLGKRKENILFAISNKGVRVEREIFPYKNLESFWIFEEPCEIYLKTKRAYLQYVTIPLPKEYFNTAKEILSKFLPEKEAERTLLDTIARKIGL
ncbi:hypothetical protein J7J39_01975 [bacterium]|nr:hypothetical protein [bacterium]